MDFANLLPKQYLQHGGVYCQAYRSVRTIFEQNGCQVTRLMMRNMQALAALAYDIMMSDAMESLRDKNPTVFDKFHAFRSPLMYECSRSHKRIGRGFTCNASWLCACGVCYTRSHVCHNVSLVGMHTVSA